MVIELKDTSTGKDIVNVETALDDKAALPVISKEAPNNADLEKMSPGQYHLDEHAKKLYIRGSQDFYYVDVKKKGE